ncbi:hypothetical protein VTH06DRAFT_3292 [Thermothelomyces fergusii]
MNLGIFPPSAPDSLLISDKFLYNTPRFWIGLDNTRTSGHGVRRIGHQAWLRGFQGHYMYNSKSSNPSQQTD